MTHPSGLDRKHPAWVDRMKRAEGGAADDDKDMTGALSQQGQAQGTADKASYAQYLNQATEPQSQLAYETHNIGNEPMKPKRDTSKDNDYP